MRRVLLKMSGEALVDATGESVIDVDTLADFASGVRGALAKDASIEIAIMVGGGNIVRGKTLEGVNRTSADQMGMLGTVINALALADAMVKAGLDCRVMTGIEMRQVAEPFVIGRAVRHLEKGRIVVLGGGMGIPLFTTDTAAAVRAGEIGADFLLLAKYGTNGVYDKDPRKNPDAVLYRTLRYADILAASLGVMDLTAVTQCMEQKVPIHVFDMEEPGGVERALLGDLSLGTVIS